MKRLIALPVLLLGLLPATAFAQFEDKSYDELMQIGMRLYNEGQTNKISYANAIRAFEAARRLNPDASIVSYNIARTYHRMGNCEQALNAYLWYQSNAIIEPDYNDVSGYISELSKQCGSKGTVSLRCVPSSAMISFDGERPVACSAHHRLKVGTHRFVIAADGFMSQEGEIEVVENETVAAEFELDMTLERQQMITRLDLSDRKQFWGGVAVGSLGILATIAGSVLMGTSYDEQDYAWENMRNDTRYYAGMGTTIAGGLAAIAGIWMIVDSVTTAAKEDRKRVNQYRDLFAVKPAVSFSSEGAAASLQFTF